MDYTEILAEIRKLPTDYRNYIVYSLLEKNDISYTQLSEAYVNALKKQKEEDSNIKGELALCIMEDVIYQDSKKTKQVVDDHDRWMHRVIAILDLVGVFQLESTKKKYNYQESIGKSGIFWEDRK